MRTFLVLARVQLRALLVSFRVGGSRKRAASGWAALVLMAGVCLYVSGVYSFALGGQLAQAGCLELLLMMLPAAAVMAGLACTAFAAQGVVFGGRDADFLLSMPVDAFTVLLAKLTALYAENLLLCAFLVLPAGAAWLWFGGGGGALFAVRLVIGVLFLALLPTVLSLAAGYLLSWLGSRLGNRKSVNLVLCLLLTAGILFLVLRLNGLVGALAAGALGLGEGGGLWSLPLRLFQQGVCGDWETLVMICLISLAPALAAVWLFSRSYRQILTGLHSRGRREVYRLGRLRTAGRRQALLRKEAARYFGTPIYLFNTGIGLIALPAGGIAAAVMGEKLRALLESTGLPVLALAVAAVGTALAMVAITASSVSLEGRTLWILKSAPVPAGEALDSKAGFQLLLEAPCLLVGTAGLAWGLGLGAAEGALLLLAGGTFACFTALLGLTVNLLFPKLDAVSPMAVVKQSMSAILATLGGMAAAAGLGLAVWTLGGILGEAGALAACALVLLVLSAGLYRWLHTRGVRRFAELL